MAITNQEILDQQAELLALPAVVELLETNPHLLLAVLYALLINDGRGV